MSGGSRTSQRWEGRQPQTKRLRQSIIWQIFLPKTVWKWNKLDRGDSLASPVGSATGNNTKETKSYHQGERLVGGGDFLHVHASLIREDFLNGEGRLHYEGLFTPSSASTLRKLRDDLGILFSLKTRMHSSRMRTARLLPVYLSTHCSGGCTCLGVYFLGVYLPHPQWIDRHV